nr:hypothetical protein [Angustibacter aerolatus]
MAAVAGRLVLPRRRLGRARGYLADGPGNSVPRFHIVWGTGPGVVEPFWRRVKVGIERGLVRMAFRHRVDEPARARRCGHRGARHRAGSGRRAARRPDVPDAGGRVRAERAGRGRDLGRHRREPRAWCERPGPSGSAPRRRRC